MRKIDWKDRKQRIRKVLGRGGFLQVELMRAERRLKRIEAAVTDGWGRDSWLCAALMCDQTRVESLLRDEEEHVFVRWRDARAELPASPQERLTDAEFRIAVRAALKESEDAGTFRQRVRDLLSGDVMSGSEG